MLQLRRLTIARKLFLGFGLTIFVFLLALGYCLWQLHRQDQETASLVRNDVAIIELLDTLQEHLDTQRRLEMEFVVTQESTLLDLLYQRRRETEKLADQLADRGILLIHLTRAYLNVLDRGLILLRDDRLDEWPAYSQERLHPLRRNLNDKTEALARQYRQSLDQAAHHMQTQSRKTLREVAALALLGTLLGLLTAIPLVLHIRTALHKLIGRTRLYSQGQFAPSTEPETGDEFSELRHAFDQMGKQLVDLQRQHLDANPLTHLPGNLAIQRQIEQRLDDREPFAHIYVDLDDFKAYNDRYGYQAGSAVIAETALVLRQSALRQGDENTFVGHIGGDDYVVLATPEQAEALATDLIREFDLRAPFFYDDTDRKAGQIRAHDRFGVERTFAIMTVSVAIVRTDHMTSPTTSRISEECARIKHELKKLPGSHYRTNI